MDGQGRKTTEHLVEVTRRRRGKRGVGSEACREEVEVQSAKDLLKEESLESTNLVRGEAPSWEREVIDLVRRDLDEEARVDVLVLFQVEQRTAI